MKNMKKVFAWMLALVMLLGVGAAAAELPVIPEEGTAEAVLTPIPSFEGTLNVRPVKTAEEAVEYAKEIFALDYLGFDFDIAYFKAEPWEEGTWIVYAKDGDEDGDYCYGDVAFDFNGNVILYENAASGFFEVANEYVGDDEDSGSHDVPGDEDALVAWREELDRKVEYPFLAEVCPQVYEEYTLLYPVNEGNNEFLTHYYDTYTDSYDNKNVFDLNYSEAFAEMTWRIKFGVQTSPMVRIVYFDAYTDAEEGGNG